MTKPGIDTPPGAQVASAASPGYGEQTADPGGYPFESLDAPSDDPRLWSKVPLELLVRYSCVPVRMNGSRLLLAFSNLDDPGQIDDLEYQLGQPIDAAIAPGQRVSEVLKLHRGGEMLLRQATDSLRLELLDEDAGDTVDLDRTSTENPIVRLVDSVILGALDRRASDIHVETKDREVLVKYRIDGALFPAIDPLDKKHHETIISRIKVMSELDIAEKRIPQDGRFRLRAKGRTVDFRVSIMPGTDRGLPCLDHAGGRRVTLPRPRVRSVAGREVELPAWTQWSREDPLEQRALQQMILGVSTRGYSDSLEKLPVEVPERGKSRSAVSRRFVEGTRRRLVKLQRRDLSKLSLAVLMIDGIHFEDHVVLVALGFENDGIRVLYEIFPIVLLLCLESLAMAVRRPLTHARLVQRGADPRPKASPGEV